MTTGPASAAAPQPPPPAPDWEKLILESAAQKPAVVKAVTFLHKWGSFSKPVRVSCDDGEVYVVKGRQSGRADLDRALVNDHVVAHLGMATGAPVGRAALVDVTELAKAEPQMSHLMAGGGARQRQYSGNQRSEAP